MLLVAVVDNRCKIGELKEKIEFLECEVEKLKKKLNVR